MEPVSRRSVLAAAAAAGTVATATGPRVAATFGNPDEPPQGAINTTGNPSSVTDPGPQNPAIASQFPTAFSPPATNVGDMPMFWASFNNAPRRIQNGGWARQVTQADFAISEEISGVNMRLTRGGIRELHWHQAAEWAYVSKGAIRITTIDSEGRSNVEDVSEGGLWYFPSGHAALAAGHRRGRRRVHSLLRRRQGDRVQHAPHQRMVRAYAAGHIGAEFRPPGRDLRKNPAARPLHFPGPDARAAGAGPGAGRRHRRPDAELFDLPARRHGAHPKDRRRRSARRRQPQFQGRAEHRRGAGDRAPRRLARNALASECG